MGVNRNDDCPTTLAFEPERFMPLLTNAAISRPLSVAAVMTAREIAAVQELVGSRDADRSRVVITHIASDIGRRAIARALRGADPDVVVLAGESGSRVRAQVAQQGWRRVSLNLAAGSAEAGSNLVAMLAEAAARPGAGRVTGPAASVVVTVLNERAAIDAVVETIRRQLGLEDELLLVDGGSTDGTLDRAADWAWRDPRIRVVEARGSNIAGGRNAGIRAARRDVIACTDAGCAPVDGWLDALRAPFAEPDPPVLVAGACRVHATDPLGRAQAVACYPDPDEIRRPTPLSRWYGRLFGLAFDPSLPFARSLAFQRIPAIAIGGFPERLGWVEDGVFGRELSQRGRCVTALDAGITWQQRPSIRATARMYFQYGMGAAQSGDAELQRRDLLRLAAYVVAPSLAAFGGRRARAAVAVGAVAYYSLPVRRALRHRVGIRSVALIPAAMAIKDVGKVAGGIAGTLRGQRRR